MAKRLVQECDLTKQEVPEGDEIVTIIIKKSGKKTGRSYELSSASAAKLEQQLVAGKEATLAAEWSFGAQQPTFAVVKNQDALAKTLGDLDSDEAFVASKKKELAESGRLEELTVEDAVLTAEEDTSCRHMNKGRVQVTLQGGKRFVFRTCTECKRKIPEATAEERKSYMSGKLPADVAIRDFQP